MASNKLRSFPLNLPPELSRQWSFLKLSLLARNSMILCVKSMCHPEEERDRNWRLAHAQFIGATE